MRLLRRKTRYRGHGRLERMDLDQVAGLISKCVHHRRQRWVPHNPHIMTGGYDDDEDSKYPFHPAFAAPELVVAVCHFGLTVHSQFADVQASKDRT